MALTYETMVPKEGAEHDCKIKFDGEGLEIKAGYYGDSYATISLEQFDAIAKEVENYRNMVAIANGKAGQINEN
ncbi:MAG: hypothetical protein ACPGQQ_02725 [Candidatus Puniceispirillaceae bacterium]